jgi:hypothetical protein
MTILFDNSMQVFVNATKFVTDLFEVRQIEILVHNLASKKEG